MKRFFAENARDGIYSFSNEESNHIIRVSRLRAGDKIIVADGENDAIAEIISDDPTCASAKLIELIPNKANPKRDITLYMACSKSDKLELCAQKACELGLSSFVPFVSKRCVKVPDDKSSVKLAARLERIAFEALKQCGRNTPMHTEKPISFKELLEKIKNTELTLFAYEASENSLKNALDNGRNAKSIALIVGCEGGFDETEAAQIENAGAECVSLGSRILRAETAAIALSSIVSFELNN